MGPPHADSSSERSGGLIHRVFEGRGFPTWKEETMLFLMGHSLWNLVLGFEEAQKGKRLEFENCRQKAYSVLALNLSPACRDCLRGLEGPDPELAWKAILGKYESSTPVNKLILLDELLGHSMEEGDTQGSISGYEQLIAS